MFDSHIKLLLRRVHFVKRKMDQFSSWELSDPCPQEILSSSLRKLTSGSEILCMIAPAKWDS